MKVILLFSFRNKKLRERERLHFYLKKIVLLLLLITVQVGPKVYHIILCLASKLIFCSWGWCPSYFTAIERKLNTLLETRVSKFCLQPRFSHFRTILMVWHRSILVWTALSQKRNTSHCKEKVLKKNAWNATHLLANLILDDG